MGLVALGVVRTPVGHWVLLWRQVVPDLELEVIGNR